MFQTMLKITFWSIPAQKTVSKELKTRYFSYSAFWLTGQWGGYSPRLPHGYAIAGTASFYGKSGPE